MNKLSKFINRSIYFCFLALAIITPLIFTTRNTELYEVPKMFFVYATSTILLTLTTIRFVAKKEIQIPKSLPFTAFVILVLITFVSSLFSTDRYTSIFGFPSRLNGGLLSQIAYLIIFTAGLINLTKEQVKKIITGLVITAVAVSLWGIPAHFGKDPSCLVLTGNLDSSCWQKEFDPTLRIFSTLGQPNWLASYLVLVLPFALMLTVLFKESKKKIFFAFASAIIFFALILTNSRSGLLGFLVSAAILIPLLGVKNIKGNQKVLALTAAVFIALAIVFGTGLTARISEALPVKQETNQPSQNDPSPSAPPAVAPTESGQIRLIVWKGAFEIFKNWPVLGSGPETFASSYYLFRPAEHNRTTEWEFFYNKAHNEFLNYLANMGTLGFLSFVAFVSITIMTLFKNAKTSFIPKAALAATIGYLVTILFGFSTVATQTVFFVILACTIDGPKVTIPLGLLGKKHIARTSLALVFLAGFFLMSQVLKGYASDTYQRRAERLGSTSKGLTVFTNAEAISPIANPYLISDFAYSNASYALSLKDEKAKESYVVQADTLAQKALTLSPNNYFVTQRTARTYMVLTAADPKYQDKARKTADLLTKLAPTYPIGYLTLAKIEATLDQNQKAAEYAQKALDLKTDYLEAKQLLEQLRANPYNNNEPASD